MSDSIRNEVTTRYRALDLRSQEELLANLAHRLTMIGRTTYAVPEGVADPRGLREINEAVHRIVDQLRLMVAGNPERYPDDVFAGILVEKTEAVGLKAAWLLKFFDENGAR